MSEPNLTYENYERRHLISLLEKIADELEIEYESLRKWEDYDRDS